MTMQTGEAPPWQKPVRHVVKLSGDATLPKVPVKGSTGGAGIPTPRSHSGRTTPRSGTPRNGSFPGGQGQQQEAAVLTSSAALQLEKERNLHHQEIDFLKEQVEQQQREIESLKAQIHDQAEDHRTKVSQITKQTDELLANQTAFHEKERQQRDADHETEIRELKAENDKRLAEAISAGEKEAARLRGIADERCQGLESSLQFRLSELEDQLQRQRSQLLADTEKKLAAQAEENQQKCQSLVNGLHLRLHKHGGVVAAFWCQHTLHVALVLWRSAVCVARSKADAGREFAQEREGDAKVAAQYRAEVDAALHRHQEESAANAQAALQKELELMKQQTILEERCHVRNACARALFDRVIPELEENCLAQVLRLWALASRLSKDLQGNKTSSDACLAELKAHNKQLEAHLIECDGLAKRAYEQQCAAVKAASAGRERILDLAEIQSLKFVVWKQWQSAITDAQHEKQLQKTIDDERQSKSLNEWSELRRQVKDERQYRKFIFIAAINEQAKRRMHVAFYWWRGETKIWALEAHLLAIEDDEAGSDDDGENP
eukprot:gnl/MRDRNA2_/MRDRNA2_97580_c0_seq1.p1 gnl/MRDRNA2_/MRDRNA2_97580_c0~~gnl/MRDRNA2_/MRDRNA2_97580_c0_seq1.p1  ORF type:complete len:559 (-),score=155.64 gnl/MRDRNA2_/MRDRNA2_97580_c0_seq1:12-1658(-)